jgi:outer membrane protein assembly factor BamB
MVRLSLTGSGHFITKGFLLKVDKDGKVLWMKKYSDPQITSASFKSIVQATDGSLIITGFIKPAQLNGAEHVNHTHE